MKGLGYTEWSEPFPLGEVLGHNKAVSCPRIGSAEPPLWMWIHFIASSEGVTGHVFIKYMIVNRTSISLGLEYEDEKAWRNADNDNPSEVVSHPSNPRLTVPCRQSNIDPNTGSDTDEKDTLFFFSELKEAALQSFLLSSDQGKGVSNPGVQISLLHQSAYAILSSRIGDFEVQITTETMHGDLWRSRTIWVYPKCMIMNELPVSIEVVLDGPNGDEETFHIEGNGTVS